MEERCQLAFECQSIDDHPALFYKAHLRTATFFLTLDFGLRLEGDEDDDTETLITSLGTKVAIDSRHFFHFHSSERSSSLSPL